MTRLYGIIGHPLGHTLSPLVHNWGFARFGIEARYEAWATLPEELPAFMARVRETPIQGLSVTIPHKTAVMDFVDVVTDLGREVGAVNTLFWRGGALHADNTDVEGFCRPLVVRGIAPGAALLLGCGGAARAVAAGLRRLQVPRIGVTGRSLDKARALALEFGLEPVAWEDRADFPAALVVNATPIGMSGRQEGVSPYPAAAWEPGRLAYDLVYNPYETRFLAEAARAGAGVVPGLEMFLYQAVEQFCLWTGRVLPDDELRPLLRQALYGG
ncbi:shikimate 5-dehydrogenase [Solidesulfovibrio carbinoliphilus subsp. oakridgensis]|uniref:Shikimate dehydrogenase (NADP(+)) n=1 Tax=Solidesulfovibrio carbinoliphilus subsp. oakridgensis TaxID=694327 RepID=G7Q960_9BACT|nr:shikimate dehydrogenase [Solidesulfovibrio carbinoliphilus]EHJ47782.1 shikimate 5-dehydrogenase [Solidesulfovibrio carbinoliphilus subsp. oakridgensis]